MIYQKLSQLIVISVLASTSIAHAESRFSVSDWGVSFKQSLKDSSGKKALQLLNQNNFNKIISDSCLDCDDKKILDSARDLFAKGQYEKSLNLYNKIAKSSPYWFQAVEEKGWAYFRLNNAEGAIAQAKTLVSPQFSEVVNSEAFFLQSLAQLKICDYKSIFETHELFKEKQKDRIVEVKTLSKDGMNESLLTVLRSVDKFPLTGVDVAESLPHLPVLYFKDIELQSQILKYRTSQKALEILRNMSIPAKVSTTAENMKSEAFDKIKLRMKDLAEKETTENKRIISRLNLVEVEAIQRIYADQSLDPNSYKIKRFKPVGEDQLVFMDDGRPWIDELDKYDVASKSCPQNIRRKM